MHHSNYACPSLRVGVMTDVSKYKSVAVKKESYKKLRTMADKDYRSVAGFIEYLIDKESEERIIGERNANKQERA